MKVRKFQLLFVWKAAIGCDRSNALVRDVSSIGRVVIDSEFEFSIDGHEERNRH